MSFLKLFAFVFVGCLILGGCTWFSQKNIVPAIVPPTQKNDDTRKTSLPIIGAVEPIYLLPMQSAFSARIDTGAEISSLDAFDIVEFERDGEKWVSFKVKNRQSNETQSFEKPIVRNTRIVRVTENEARYIVKMDVRFGGKSFSSDFTLVNREKFKYQVLIGRNILSGRAIVDTTRSFTLR